MLLDPWEGNVREVAASVARLAVAMRLPNHDLEAALRKAFDDPPRPLPAPRVPPGPPDEAGLQATVALFEGNISGVSRYYGKERQQVYRWMQRFGLKTQ